MEVNDRIKKYQAGGYVSYQPLPSPPQGGAVGPANEMADTEKPEKEDAYLDKTTLNKMLGEGITTDVMAYSDGLQQAYMQYSKMNDFQKNSYRGKQLRNMLKGDLGQLNALIRGKKTLDESINNAKSNGALEEFAVTSNGMVVKDVTTGKITTVSFQQFAADNNTKEKKYEALTNTQLASEREFNKQLMGNTGVYAILNYGKGIEKVRDEILKSVAELGNTKRSVSNGAFEPSDREDVQQLIEAAKNGTFKVKSGESQESNSPQIEKAKMAMWMTLSDNSKNVLRARAATTVQNPGEIEKYAMTMAASLLDPMLDTSSSKMYDESLSKGAKGANGGKPGANDNIDGYEAAWAGISNMTPLSQIGDQGVKIEGIGYRLPPSAYSDNENKRVPLQNAGKLNLVGKLAQAFVGNGDKVRANETMITGDAFKTKMPVKIDENGNMKIDEDGAKRWAAFEKEFKSLPISEQTPMKESELRQKHNAVNLVIRDLIVAEATSYDEAYSVFSKRDKKYYQDVNDSELNYFREALDPDQKTHARNMVDYAAHKHLIFIPANDIFTARQADGNHGEITGGVHNVAPRNPDGTPRIGFNTGAMGSNIIQGTTMGKQQVPPTLGKDFWGIK